MRLRPVPPPGSRLVARETGTDAGVAVVEFALVVPVLLMLLFGIVDFGITLNDHQALRQGVREAARDASVLVLPGGCTGTTAERVACDAERRIGKGAAATYVKVVPPTTWNKEGTVLVCAQQRATSTTGVTGPFLERHWLRAKLRVRIEKNGGGTTPFQETIPAGTSWSWCS
jgi:hypothetical protein